MIRLIADAGATKTKWALIDSGWEAMDMFRTDGLNPAVMPGSEIESVVRDVALRLERIRVDEVFFYGAGCLDQFKEPLVETFRSVLGCEGVEVCSDMLGAARALCGHEAGIACILGTGSNSCLYDGTAIVENVAPLGYILGDEGSGAVIGRRFLGDLLKGQLPQTVGRIFRERCGHSREDIIRRVYRGTAPSRFLASFMPIVRECLCEPAVEDLVVDEFCRFLRRNVAAYNPAADNMPVNFMGSVACHFRPQLLRALGSCGMTAGRIIDDPIPGLIEYHKRK